MEAADTMLRRIGMREAHHRHNVLLPPLELGGRGRGGGAHETSVTHPGNTIVALKV